jgi:hypothetical protein
VVRQIAVRRQLEERVVKELAAFSKVTDKFLEKKAARHAKAVAHCLERSLKLSLYRQRLVTETLERCR